MKKKVLTFIFISILSFTSIAWGQPPGGGCGPDPEAEECSDEFTPIDTGVSFLLSVSLFYGILKLRKPEG